MRTWTFDLTYRRGQLTGNRMRPPRGTQIREMGLELLGEHATHNTSHDNDLKPRALWFDPPGPHTPGTLQLTWLSDHWPPPRTPPATGRLNWGQGTSIIEFASRATPTTITAIALHHHFTHHTDTETWTTARLRTRSGVLFKRDHTHYLTATHLLDAITNRWTLLTTWTPPGLAETPTPSPSPPTPSTNSATASPCTQSATAPPPPPTRSRPDSPTPPPPSSNKHPRIRHRPPMPPPPPRHPRLVPHPVHLHRNRFPRPLHPHRTRIHHHHPTTLTPPPLHLFPKTAQTKPATSPESSAANQP